MKTYKYSRKEWLKKYGGDMLISYDKVIPDLLATKENKPKCKSCGTKEGDYHKYLEHPKDNDKIYLSTHRGSVWNIDPPQPKKIEKIDWVSDSEKYNTTLWEIWDKQCEIIDVINQRRRNDT